MTAEIAILTAIPKEHAAAKLLLEDPVPINVTGDPTLYTKGYIQGRGGKHSVILACLSKYANNPAAVTTTNLIRSFPTVKDIVFVGIAAGVPRPDNADAHVRLGDIVVSSGPGVIQFDIGAQRPSSFEIRDTTPPPSARLLQAVNQLESELLVGHISWESFLSNYLSQTRVKRPPKEPTKAFRHPVDPQRRKGIPRIFRGKIGASNTLMKSADHRDPIAEKLGLLAIEMEGSGVADATWEANIGYLLIRSACDYGDEKKDDSWQEYAAHACAAYLGILLLHLPISGEGQGTLVQGSTPNNTERKTPHRAINDGSNINCLDVTNNRLTCCRYMASQDIISTGGFDGNIYFLSPTNKKIESIDLGKSIVRLIKTVPGRSFIITGDDIGCIKKIDVERNSIQEISRTKSPVYSLFLLPEKHVFYSAERNGEIVEWDYDFHNSAARSLRVVHQHKGAAFDVQYDEYSQTCWSVGADGQLLGTDMVTGQLSSCKLSDYTLFSVASSKSMILIGDSKGQIFSGRIGTGDFKIHEGHLDAVRKVILSKSGQWGCSASKDGTLRLWHLPTHRGWIIAESKDYFYDIEFHSSDGVIIACDGGGNILKVNLGQPIDELSPHALDSWCAASRKLS